MSKIKKNWKLNWESKKLTVKSVPKYRGRNEGRDRGKGVFSKFPIKKNEIITIFGGYIIPISYIKHLPLQLQEYCYQIHDDFFYGPVKKSEVSVAECYNHSCSPNAGFKDTITLIATRNIKKGEEVTIDYATCLTTDNFDFKCNCGTKDCRLKISGNDWKLPKLQKTHKSYFQPYILEKILKLNKK